MTALTGFATMYREREALPLRTRLLFTFGAVAALHLAAVVLLLVGAAGAAQPLALGLVVTAYVAGIKHSYDWDHIAAIDNSTRKFVAQRKDPVSVGFAFSLGHSSVVIAAGMLVVAGASMIGQFMEDGTTGNKVLGLIGSGVSGLFLLAMGLFNGSAFFRAAHAYRSVRAGGEVRPEDLEAKGFVARLLAKPLRKVERPRNIYVIGFLFGLGFDTATEVSLLILAGGAAASALPWYAILTLPVLFAAGMSLLDSLDGCLMNFAYGWALSRPVRRVYYNIVITALSVAVALGIGSIELISLLVERAGISSGPLAAIGGIDLDAVGYTVVALFVCTWILALGVWRFGHIEERWAAPVRDTDTSPGG